jgi:hypothetical protein
MPVTNVPDIVESGEPCPCRARSTNGPTVLPPTKGPNIVQISFARAARDSCLRPTMLVVQSSEAKCTFGHTRCHGASD